MSQPAFKLRLRSALEDVPDSAAEEVVRVGFWRAREVAPWRPAFPIAEVAAPQRAAKVVDLAAWKRR
jgi:hypothetical protein